MKWVGPSAFALVEPVECPTFMGLLWVQRVGDANEESRFSSVEPGQWRLGPDGSPLWGCVGVQVLRGRSLPFLLPNGKSHLG